ncbi:ATP-binding protein [Pseudohalocynthiibacter sp. F2068]|uniref:AAA family ATPase n=1 Tax=Pseudohalocynthiibacter sp. F2068 TaxID=2926418 RepID=UPI001FF31943|nr:ATP-binding protein [Pseudohalocynthiibacter sp. F2068]MCK0104602.1 ATP-binding protein [Pseudohalocynthiibacter sp. F2068]
MAEHSPTLYMFCGKIASGKSTLAFELSQAPNTVLISEDKWLGALFADQMSTGADYLHYSSKFPTVMAPHVAALLGVGISVVLDFPANTVAQRRWMRNIVQQGGFAHQMHVLDPPDDVCLERLHARNAEGEHEFSVTEEQFHKFAKHFVPPTKDEGFNVIQHRDGDFRDLSK